MPDICPRCGSGDIFGKKFGMGGFSIIERKCRACELFEYKSTADADFAEWYARWSTPDDVEEDERAEFIRLQVERFASERASGAQIGRPSAREKELREKRGDEWARCIRHYARPYLLDAPYQGYEFERGFVAQIRTDPDTVSDPASRLFELAPIEHLDLTTNGDLRKALVSPQLAKVRTLSLNKCGLTDDDVRAFADEGHLDRLEWLDLCLNPFGRAGVEALVASPAIRRIPVVLLGSHPYNPGTQFDADFYGRYSEFWLPEYGQVLEAKYGRVDWFHLPHFMHQPDRYHARAVRYVD